MKKDPIDILPNEMREYILSFLFGEDQASFQKLLRQFNSYKKDKILLNLKNVSEADKFFNQKVKLKSDNFSPYFFIRSMVKKDSFVTNTLKSLKNIESIDVNSVSTGLMDTFRGTEKLDSINGFLSRKLPWKNRMERNLMSLIRLAIAGFVTIQVAALLFYSIVGSDNENDAFPMRQIKKIFEKTAFDLTVPIMMLLVFCFLGGNKVFQVETKIFINRMKEDNLKVLEDSNMVLKNFKLTDIEVEMSAIKIVFSDSKMRESFSTLLGLNREQTEIIEKVVNDPKKYKALTKSILDISKEYYLLSSDVDDQKDEVRIEIKKSQ